MRPSEQSDSETGLPDPPSANAGYMGPEHKAFFRAILEHERRKIMARIDRSVQALREQENLPEEVDRAQLNEQRALELRLRDRDRRHLGKIRAALLRLDRDEYGWCEETGEPIGLERLKARPTATLSVEGKEIREQIEKAYVRSR